MRLTDDQLQEFDETGYLFLPGVFSAAEAALLRREADTCFTMEREEVWREDNGAPRSAFAAHRYNEAYRRIAAHPRLLEPVMQILDGQVYMHQFKINAKAAFDGAVWQWHQDYGTWQRDDDMPEPRTLRSAWREMLDTWERQQSDPDYQYDTPLPATAGRVQLTDFDELESSIGDLAPTGLK